MEQAVFGKLNDWLDRQGFSNQYTDEHYEARKQDTSPEILEHILKYKKLASWDYYNPAGDFNPRIPEVAVQTTHYWTAWWHHPIAGTFDLTVAIFPAPSDGYLTRLKLRLCEGEDALDNDEYQRHGLDFNVLNIELPCVTPDSTVSVTILMDILFKYLQRYDPSAYFDVSEE